MQQFIQRARGTATLPVVPGSHHCSITEPAIDIIYRIVITYDVKALDEKGFLVDNVAFGAYFANLARTPIDYSCELLARKVARHFLALLGERKVYVQGVSVTIEPFPGVGVEYRAKREEIIA